MGATHAATGAVAWLAGCATAAAFGHDPGVYQVVVGTPLAAFGAIWPDIDHPSASIARSLGWPTRRLADLVAWAGRRLHAATRTPLDRVDLDGHRTITHTVLFCVLSFVGFGVLGQYGGVWAPTAMIAFATATALRALKVRRRRRFVIAAIVALLTTGVGPVIGLLPGEVNPAVLAELTWLVELKWPAPSGWWLGWAIGGGALVHNLGDRMTNTGVPLAFPVKIGGKRWRTFKSARWCRFETGAAGNPEGLIRFCSLAGCLIALAGMAHFRWPQVAAGVNEVAARVF